ncbi:MAG: hypothetical protein IBX47_05020 [Desulfuromonadales bacterium]|nr:hypothetical protein [Desulfuromonadales bacterium]
MTCLISFLNKFFTAQVMLTLGLGAGLLTGCAGVDLHSGVFPVTADQPAPQMAGTGPIDWSVAIPGDVGELNIIFELEQAGNSAKKVQSGAESTWSFYPEEAGDYRIRTIVEENLLSRIEGDWSRSYEIAPPLAVGRVKRDKDSPQTALSTVITWSVEATGGVGALHYGFELEKDGDPVPTFNADSSETWEWTPDSAGSYRVRATVTDRLGNQVEGDWSESFEIAPPLRIESLTSDQPAPRMAGTGPIIWTVAATGGVGEQTVRFELERNDGWAKTVQSAIEATWSWLPEQEGRYRVRTIIADRIGNQLEGEWSEPYEIAPPLKIERLTADKKFPQAARTAPIVWTPVATGGVGELNTNFELEQDGTLLPIVATENSVPWRWTPEEPGNYRIRAVATDSLGNKVEVKWSEPFAIAPPLVVENLTVDKPSPQAARSEAMIWTVTAGGGVGRLRQSFELEKDGSLQPRIAAGLLAPWSWAPVEPGSYRIRAVVTDRLGNTAEGNWSVPFEIAPPLKIENLTTNKPAPQAAMTGPFIWTLTTSGGVGEDIITFELEQKGQEPVTVQAGVESTWSWRPEQAGKYRVRPSVEDSLGNRVEGDWSAWYEIAPPLTVESLTADKSFPQAAQTVPIEWSAVASGGVGPLHYDLELERNGEQLPMISTVSAGPWTWTPQEGGLYRIRVVVTDSRANKAKGGWSEPFEIAPPLVVERLTADRNFPQTALGAVIAWTVTATGGVGALRQSIELEKDGQRLPPTTTEILGGWSWKPEQPGSYRIRAVVTDALGNRTKGNWSKPIVIAPPLTIEKLYADRSNPQAAQSAAITWSVVASGGVGNKTYLFELSHNEEIEQFAQEGPDTNWSWIPETEGQYRIRVLVADALGNRLQSDWSEPYEIRPPLEVSVPIPDNPASQYLIHSRIKWSAEARGGVGKKKYTFTLEQKSGEVATTPVDSADAWIWQPKKTGFYRIQVSVLDARGNQQTSPWSDWKEIRAPLSLAALNVSAASPRPALQETITWSAGSSGGVGIVTYEFRSIMQGVESIEQRSSSPFLDWQPRKAGLYRIKVRVWDDENRVVESAWSDDYRIKPAVTTASRVAFLPIVNLADVKAPIQKIGELFKDLLRKDLQLLPEAGLESFMQTHRMRYTGGLNATLAQALRKETEVEAVFITALETWKEGPSPQISLISRLVTTGDAPEIVWIDSVGLTGEDSPGLLGLGKTGDAEQLLEMALSRLMLSLQTYLDGNAPIFRHDADQQEVRLINGNHERADGTPFSIKRRHQPQFTYRASTFDPAGQYRVAMIPFMNINTRKYSGEIIALHTVKQLHRYDNIRIFEPGLIRETLLNYRMIMQSGPSLAAADVLTDAAILGADIVASGKVFDYQEELGKSRVDFSIQVFDGVKREILWASRSSATGNQGVYLFNWGKVPSAHGLTSRMTQSAIQQMQE